MDHKNWQRFCRTKNEKVTKNEVLKGGFHRIKNSLRIIEVFP